MVHVNCNLCGKDETRFVARLPDWQNLGSGFEANLVECLNCGLIYQNPSPTQEELSAYYPDEYDCYQPEMDPARMNGLVATGAAYGMQKRCNLILREKSAGRLLDVGCATGVFLESMKRYPGWELHGVEMNRRAAEIARARGGVQIETGTLEQSSYPEATFDAVTLWDVLEHLTDPSASLREISRILKPGGILVLRVPNGNSWEAGLLGKYWAGYEPPRHLFVFRPQTLSRLVEQSGLSVRRTGCVFGGYLVFLLGLRFWMSGSGFPAHRRELLLKVLGGAVPRLAAAPLFALFNLGLHGPLLDMTAVRTVSGVLQNA